MVENPCYAQSVGRKRTDSPPVEVRSIPHRQPWDRLPRETAQQFAKFRQYRDLPAHKRTIAQASRELGSSYRSLFDLSERQQWQARVTAYDEYIDAIAQDRHVESILEIRGRLLDIARRKVSMLTPDDFTPMDIVSMVHKVAPPSKRVEHEVSLHRVDNAAESLPPAAVEILTEYVPPSIESGSKHDTPKKESALLPQDVVASRRK